MHGPIVSLFGYGLSGYAAMIAFGFLMATAMGALWVKRIGQNPDSIVDLGLVSVVSGLVGARLMHVLADGFFWDYVWLCTAPERVDWRVDRVECGPLGGVWSEQLGYCHPAQADCWAWAQVWGGGLTFYGGLIGATAAAVLLFRRDRFPFWKGADMGGMMVPVGLGLGRLGCLLVGCCFGKVCELPWAVRFPGRSPASEWQHRAGLLDSASHWSLPVHPTQLYEAAAALTIAAVLIAYASPRKRYDGQIFVAFLAMYAIARFLLEFMRSDDRGGWLLSTSQWVGVGLLLAAVGLHRWLSRRHDSRAMALGGRAS